MIGLVLAGLWRIPFLLSSPGPDDDIHRYLWDGRVQRFGYNPYLVVPSDPAVRELHAPGTRTMNNPDLPSSYPPGTQMFFRAITTIHESLFSLKVAFVFCDLAIVLVLLEILRSSGQGAHWVLAYAWHPLLATDVAGSGHIDIVGVLLLLVSAAALGRRWRAVAAVAFRLAVAVKFLPNRTPAALLETCSHPRRHTGGHRSWTPLCAVLKPWTNSHRFTRNLRAEFPLQ